MSCTRRYLSQCALSIARGKLLPSSTSLEAGVSSAACITACSWHSWPKQDSWVPSRRFCTPVTGREGTSQLLDSLAAAKLRDQIESLSHERPYMTYPQLLDLIKEQGVADTDEEAHDRADTLQQAGVILRFNGIVYLKPHEIAELVFRALPTDASVARNRLEEVETELKVMDAKYKAIQQYAKRWPRRWVNLGCIILFTQLVGFSYLTWWELSWDVMEPFSYILSVFYSLMAYMYFLYTRGSYFDYGPFEEYWTEKLLEKRMAQEGFDLQRYEHLVRTRDRYRRYMAASATAPHLKMEPAEDGQQPAAGPLKVKAA